MFGSSQQNDSSGPLSLKRITDAFAAMLGQGGKSSPSLQSDKPTIPAIIEAMLFVGTPGDEPLSAEKLATVLREVDQADVLQAIDELNATYERHHSAMRIVQSAGGFRLALRDEYEMMRQKYLGRLKGTTLSPAALEVLSVVAYRQPVDLATIDRLRDTKSHALLAQLVRRGLIVRQQPRASGERAAYSTTSRFLSTFGIDSVDQLPRAEEFDLPDLSGDRPSDSSESDGAQAA